MEYPYKLSIITINLNNREGLQKTIDSVINQTCQDLEWIIIDGGSTDGSKELIEKYSEHINYWVSEPDKGIYNAMNKGIIKSQGKYLLFLNSGDILYRKDVIENIICRLNLADIYVGNQKSKDVIFHPSTDPIALITTLVNMTLPHQASFIKKDLFSRFGLYNEEYRISSDWKFFIKTIILNNCTVEKLPYIISEIQPNGISVRDQETLLFERQKILGEISRITKLSQYHTENVDILKALKYNKFIFFIFRCYFFFYRKFYK